MADDERQIIVMADLGTHPTLATALLGDDPGWAWTSCLAWAAALGEQINPQPGVVAAAHATLGQSVDQDQHERAEAPRVGLAKLAKVGIEVDAAMKELLDAVAQLEEDQSRHALETVAQITPC